MPKKQIQFGAVDSVTLQNEWTVPERKSVAGRKYESYISLKYPSVKFSCLLREVPLSHKDALSFEQTLYSEFHQLTSAETEQLSAVLEAIANSENFEIEEAFTCYLNSRRVLRLQGRWLQKKERMLAIFIDVNGNGQIVQQMSFVAGENEFAQAIETAEAIFLSIDWIRQSKS